MKTLYRCIAGIDVHKKMLAVVIRRQSKTSNFRLRHRGIFEGACATSERLVLECSFNYFQGAFS